MIDLSRLRSYVSPFLLCALIAGSKTKHQLLLRLINERLNIARESDSSVHRYCLMFFLCQKRCITYCLSAITLSLLLISLPQESPRFRATPRKESDIYNSCHNSLLSHLLVYLNPVNYSLPPLESHNQFKRSVQSSFEMCLQNDNNS